MIHSSKDLSMRTTNSRYEGTTFAPPEPKGDGFTVEGKLIECRRHHVRDASGKYYRFFALTVAVDTTRIRVFNEQGEERDPQFLSSDQKGRTGFLNCYYKKDTKDPYRVENDELQRAIGDGQSAMPAGYCDLQRGKLHPNTPGAFEFWQDQSALAFHDNHIKAGNEVVIRTKGNSIFIDEVSAKKDAGSASFAASDSGQNWHDKVFAQKDAVTKPIVDERQPGDACDEDEWD
mmetsp:Transcript_11454/g.32179  ORF Transcript_11454/g.32179 Transcript_11454/m.32179 type:complete len:232 (+) Transcript_11454:135-830(+)